MLDVRPLMDTMPSNVTMEQLDQLIMYPEK
jgi:hypothetical protein